MVSFNYGYNSANQRTTTTSADNSYWLYGYDGLGQVTSGKRYWSDNTPVTGQQFEYVFDDIGNRRKTGSGGNNSGGNLHYANHRPNWLNEFISREVPGAVQSIGTANSSATVTLWSGNWKLDHLYTMASRKGTYYWGELLPNNTTGAMWLTITNLAVVQNGTSPDIVTNTVGNAFLPQTLEYRYYDVDGNLTTDGRWQYTWDAQDRLASTCLLSVPEVDCLSLTHGQLDPRH